MVLRNLKVINEGDELYYNYEGELGKMLDAKGQNVEPKKASKRMRVSI